MTGRAFCTFRVAELMIGVEVARVQEVLSGRHVTPVPLSQPCVAGIVNLRGQIVTVVDMRARLGLDIVAAGNHSVHVVVASAGELVSLIVDREGDVVDIDDAMLEDITDVVDAAISTCVTSTSKIDGRLLLVIDPDRVLPELAA
jgi:purine-binding chemotaxis protein CheW